MPIAAAASGLFLLAILACPVSMGLMMLFMGRGMMGGRRRQDGGSHSGGESLEALKAEQERLAERIASLDSPASSHGSAVADAVRESKPERSSAATP